MTSENGYFLWRFHNINCQWKYFFTDGFLYQRMKILAVGYRSRSVTFIKNNFPLYLTFIVGILWSKLVHMMLPPSCIFIDIYMHTHVQIHICIMHAYVTSLLAGGSFANYWPYFTFNKKQLVKCSLLYVSYIRKKLEECVYPCSMIETPHLIALQCRWLITR